MLKYTAKTTLAYNKPYYTENRYSVLSCLQNLLLKSVVLICEGSEFQAKGPATQNALSASFVLVLGTTKSPRNAERKRSSLQVLHNKVYSEWGCRALDNVEHQHTQLVHIKIGPRFSIGSQCRFWSSGVVRENTGCEWMTRAALFWMRCSRRRTVILQLANIALQ